VRGHVNQILSLSLNDILHSLPRVELVAVNQCSGNSRGFFEPRVPGGQWANGAMGNARWAGVRLKDVLDRAGVKAGAVQVRFSGMDQPVVEDAPYFRKSLDIDHARDGEVMIAYAMNDDQLPLDAAGADAINNNRLACHSAGMVLNQPALSKAGWTTEVNKMINAYKAPVDPDDAAAIIDYLTRTKGAK
jgi:hypothetical protein